MLGAAEDVGEQLDVGAYNIMVANTGLRACSQEELAEARQKATAERSAAKEACDALQIEKADLQVKSCPVCWYDHVYRQCVH